MFRIAAGIPRYGLDITDRTLPQETAQQQVLNFNKGCYIGQEIVERIRARGNVHRTLTGFVVQGELPPHGTKITLDGKEVGEITSASAIPSSQGERVLALGIARREAAKPGTAVQVGQAEAIVTDLPFPEATS
jgi:folate-binding protein YgfZ